MSASKLQAIADALVVRLETIEGLKAYSYEPRDVEQSILDGLIGAAAATVLGPTEMTRTAPEDPESQLGADDWHTTWMVRLYISMDDPESAQRDFRRLLGQFIAAVDAGRGLGGEALDASVTKSDLGFSEPTDLGKQLVIGECQVEVWSLV